MGVRRVFYWSCQRGNDIQFFERAKAAVLKFDSSVSSEADVEVQPWKEICYLQYELQKTEINQLTATANSLTGKLYRVHFSDLPSECFFLVGNDLIQAETQVLSILRKLKNLQTKVETSVEGSRFNLGDVIVRLGVFRRRNNTTPTLVMDIEYRPCLLAVGGQQKIEIILDTILSHLPTFGKPTELRLDLTEQDYGLSHEFGPRHSALQYIKLFETITSKN
mmetsp:Transcript_16462/g.18619  ORF Transcript_16462/g.18619 Transcript_16462/m.18619 type:complete len:221 (-) Transcript_16462:325-987(-)